MKKIVLNAHPFLYTALSLLLIYMGTNWENHPTAILRPLVLLWLVILGLFPLAYKLVRSWEWTGILLTVFVFGLYFQEESFLFIGGSVLVLLLLFFIIFFIMGRRFTVSEVSFVLTLTGFMFVIVELIMLINSLRSIPPSYYKAMKLRDKSMAIPFSISSIEQKPDIYFIVLDAYAGSDVLSEFYDYDNSEFIDYLEELGFVIPEKVYSNYPRTGLSLSSTLDMQYWDTISPGMEDVSFWWPVKPVMDYSRVHATLEAIGYQSVSIASGWSITDNQIADKHFKSYGISLTEYENYVISATPIQILHAPFQNIMSARTNNVHRGSILYSLETLKELPKFQGPKFVFAHLIIPHPPFVFDADGNPIDSSDEFTFKNKRPEGITQDEYRQMYIGQVKYLNTQLVPIIEALLNESETEPIIILQADHGLGLSIDFYSPETLMTGCLRERFSTLGAYYLPGKKPDVFPEDFTTVNLFRVIFNEYFDANMELLDNRQYFTRGHGLFTGMQDVTEMVDDTCVVR